MPAADGRVFAPVDRFAPLPPAFYRRSSEAVARDLLGRYLVRRTPGSEPLVLRLVETEAYLGAGDRASHAHAGPVTERSRRLYRGGGHAYVYLIYGMYWCLNAVCNTEDDGHAVLLRSGEAVAGTGEMRARRGFAPERRLKPGDLAGGPGKLCRALGIDRSFDGAPLWEGELVLTAGEPVADGEVVRGARVGVGYAGEAAEWPLRFAVRGNPEVSRPRL